MLNERLNKLKKNQRDANKFLSASGMNIPNIKVRPQIRILKCYRLTMQSVIRVLLAL